MPEHAIVLFAHGSRDPLWCRPIEAVAARMRQLDPTVPVACAYLESMHPDLSAAAAGLIAAGASDVSVVPMFLGVGRHAREDLPALVSALALVHPRVRFDLRQAMGEDPRVVDLMAEIALS